MEDKATQNPVVEHDAATPAPAPQAGESSATPTNEAHTNPEPTAVPAPSAPASDPASRPAPANAEEYPAMTMEDVLASEEDRGQEVSRGDVIQGTVVFVGAEGVAVDVGAKIEGVIPLSQLADEPLTLEQAQEQFKAGDKIDAYVVRSDVQNGVIVLSKKRAEQDRGWRKLTQVSETNGTIMVQIEEQVRGGLVAMVEGVRAFLPASQVDVRRVNDLTPYVGHPLEVRIIELNRKRNRVIISHRAIVEEQKNKAKTETLDKLVPGATLEGTVVEVTDFGVFISLGGVDGLVHRSELTYGRFNHPKDVVKLGDEVKVQVIDVDRERDRINLSMKSLTQDPWGHAVEAYHIGQRVKGKVTNLTNFGAFVEIEAGLEGLIHVSEMSWTKRIRHPNEVLKEGDEVEAVILRIDPKDRRISLGLRQTTPDPWSELPAKYPPGTPVKGKITGLTDFGVFMELEEGIEGLIHISELAHERVTNPADLFKKGDEIEAVVLNIDPVDQRASLSRKRTLPGGPPIREERTDTAPRYSGGSSGGAGGGNRYSGGGGSSNRGGQGGGGGRRRETFDYDYSSSSASGQADSGGKVTTKLGDVYADLFAQFGLGGGKKADDAKPTEAKAEDAPVEAAAPVETAPVESAPAHTEQSAEAHVEANTEPTTEAQPETHDEAKPEGEHQA
jgi:small subunit ribosomal protein S1